MQRSLGSVDFTVKLGCALGLQWTVCALIAVMDEILHLCPVLSATGTRSPSYLTISSYKITSEEQSRNLAFESTFSASDQYHRDLEDKEEIKKKPQYSLVKENDQNQLIPGHAASLLGQPKHRWFTVL